VTVAPDAEQRREAMVEDWWASYAEGEDALMVAKRNVEVERLNATARELLRSEGRLGSGEIEVGGASFAAGDQVITRVNERAADIYNRERWQVAEVDPERGRVVLEGIDQPRRVEVGPDYLGRTALNGDAPALQHAYAVTTYCAQGTTVDRAFVMADPSMDKQEFYVATSRSREETRLYATPEIQAERTEYAPTRSERGAISHIAEAAERDRGQTAAHDAALRAELAKLPTEQLAKRSVELGVSASAEGGQEAAYDHQVRAVEERREQYASAIAHREKVEGLGWRERRQKLPHATENERLYGERLAEERAKLEPMRQPTSEARLEHQVAEQLLATRQAQSLTALGVDPPPYIVKELGERPSDPAKGRAWDSGANAIEDYRRGHGIEDKRSAIGHEPKGNAERWAWKTASRRLEEAQRSLRLERQLARTRQLVRSAARGIGIEL